MDESHLENDGEQSEMALGDGTVSPLISGDVESPIVQSTPPTGTSFPKPGSTDASVESNTSPGNSKKRNFDNVDLMDESRLENDGERSETALADKNVSPLMSGDVESPNSTIAELDSTREEKSALQTEQGRLFAELESSVAKLEEESILKQSLYAESESFHQEIEVIQNELCRILRLTTFNSSSSIRQLVGF